MFRNTYRSFNAGHGAVVDTREVALHCASTVKNAGITTLFMFGPHNQPRPLRLVRLECRYKNSIRPLEVGSAWDSDVLKQRFAISAAKVRRL